MGDAIWRFTAEGKLSRFYPPPNDDRPLRVGSGGDPFAVDRDGNVYAVNSRRDRFTQLVKIGHDGRLGVPAGRGWGFLDGKGTEAKFGDLHASSMLVLSNADLLLTDHWVRVRRVAADGAVTTLAGGRESGYVDGPGFSARFDGAHGLAVDGNGNVLIVEHRGRIRSLSPAGVVTTFAGSAGTRSQDGPLAEATFDGPTGIAVAPNGDMFVLEPGGPRVRKISAGRVTTIYRGSH